MAGSTVSGRRVFRPRRARIVVYALALLMLGTLVWIAFALLIAGITITFYRPRRRVWTRLAPDGSLGIVWRSDRYVDVEREFGRLLDRLVAARKPA